MKGAHNSKVCYSLSSSFCYLFNIHIYLNIGEMAKLTHPIFYYFASPYSKKYDANKIIGAVYENRYKKLVSFSLSSYTKLFD